ncbi:hypothetical protein B9D02_07585 [Pantoea vagans]|nr:hypothetical protein [Pantoea vagans]AWP32455.1 hypothetical protein B9D02_07585 [Pantoea vagans]
MKFLNIKTSAAAAIIIAGISSHAAIAALSEASATSADITFTTPLTVSNVLTPVSGLSDGNIGGQVLANGTITSTGGASRHYIAFGMPGSLTGSDNGTTQASLSIKGKNDSNNAIIVSILRSTNTPSSAGSTRCSELDLTCNTDYILYSTATNGVSTYNVTLNGTQNVKADTYTVQTTAYAYGD